MLILAQNVEFLEVAFILFRIEKRSLFIVLQIEICFNRFDY